MNKVFHLDTVNDYCNRFNRSALHPLVSVLDLSTAKRKSQAGIEALRFNFYAVFLKQNKDCILKYGRKYYDFQEGTLVFAGPGQEVIIESGDDYVPSGLALLFHPDLLHATPLAGKIHEYSFFSYEIHEALHLSDRERRIVTDCFDKILFELERDVDKHSKQLIVSNIELFLSYCNRFYDRQFITRDVVNDSVIKIFERSLNDYLRSGKAGEFGCPTVNYFADEQHLSPNYFGDLVKRETGKSALEIIQAKLIAIAKEQFFDTSKTVSEIAYELGFKYPQHFTRMFKKKTGISPNEYRMMN